MRVAINGFGRIGRAVFRIAETLDDIEIVAINDLFDNDALAYLLTYDTVMGRFEGDVKIEDEEMVTPRSRVRMLKERDPKQLPWRELGIDAVVEATGVFRSREQVAMHLEAGAKRALLTVPAKDEIDYTVVLGVNEDGLSAEHRIVSNASCTTNCLAPLAKVLNDAFGIREGVINTVHAYTNDQSLADVPHSDWRRSRAAAENIILREAASSDRMVKVLEYTEEPVVSSDIIGNPHSSIFDAPLTQVGSQRFIKVLSWYDNEWGYSNRICDVLAMMDKLDG